MNTLTYAGRLVSLTTGAGRPKFKVELLKEGKYAHPAAPGGELVIDQALLAEIKANHEAGARGTEIPTNMGHSDPFCKDSPAWIQDMELEKGADGKLHLFGVGEITDKALHEKLEQGRVKYFSPELLFGWEDPADRKKKNVMKAGAFTNVPHIKGMQSVVLNFEELVKLDAGFAKEAEESEEDNDEDYPGNEDAQDPDAKADDLPDQCRSCNQLQVGSCPFKGIELKEAAAGQGTCPQYGDREVLRNNTPQTGDEDGGTNMGEKPENGQAVSLEEFNQLKKQVADVMAANVALQEADKVKNEQLAKIPVLLAENAELKAKGVELSDQAFIKARFDTGRINAAQAKTLEKLLKVQRGAAEVLLSDEKTPATAEALLAELLDAIPVQVDLGPVQKAVGESADYETKLDEMATNIAKEKAKETGKPWTDHYGEAIGLASKQLGGN